MKDICDWELRETNELLEIMHQNGEGVSLMPYYLIEYLDEMLYFEFTEMLKNGQFVKRCRLCNRYFVLTDKRKRDFVIALTKSRAPASRLGQNCFMTKVSQGAPRCLLF